VNAFKLILLFLFLLLRFYPSLRLIFRNIKLLLNAQLIVEAIFCFCCCCFRKISSAINFGFEFYFIFFADDDDDDDDVRREEEEVASSSSSGVPKGEIPKSNI
jgi:hypothetical protein